MAVLPVSSPTVARSSTPSGPWLHVLKGASGALRPCPVEISQAVKPLLPPPPSQRSVSRPPLRRSSPAAPTSRSRPGPPQIRSSPLPPRTVSLPPPAAITSAAAVPASFSLAAVPTIVAALPRQVLPFSAPPDPSGFAATTVAGTSRATSTRTAARKRLRGSCLWGKLGVCIRLRNGMLPGFSVARQPGVFRTGASPA